MARFVKRHLKVGNSPEWDEGALMVRLHPDDLPKGIKWNSYVHLRIRGAKTTCRVRDNDMAEVPHPRVHQININRDLRDAMGLKVGKVYDCYLKKAPRWKAPLYVMRYHPMRSARRRMLARVLGALATTAVAVGLLLYFLTGS